MLRKREIGASHEACLASSLLAIEVGARIPTVRDLAAQCGLSVGAAQAALVRLEEGGAITVRRRGRHGSWLVARSEGLLLSASLQRALLVTLPLPSTLRVQGLASGLRAALAGAGVDARFTFSRGSKVRLAALVDGACDVAVMSCLAAGAIGLDGTRVAVELPAHTFVQEHRVYYIEDGAPGQLRVGIDRDSTDFELLTELEFPPSSVRFVPGTYMESVARMGQGQVDALVLDSEEAFARMPLHAKSRELSPATRRSIGTRNTSAAMVVREQDVAIASALRVILTGPVVSEVQRQVLSGARMAEY